jgi:pilus assembly protein Flp/PilA
LLNERHSSCSRRWKNLFRYETGATAIEYGLIAALISVAAVTVLTTVGTNLTSTFSTVARKL